MGFDLFGAVGSIFGGGSPIGSIIDGIGGALGLPKEITDVAKIGQAFFTGDFMSAISGGMDLLGGAMKNAPPAATTECPKGPSSSGYAHEAVPADKAKGGGPLDFLTGGEKALKDGNVLGFIFGLPSNPLEIFLGPHLPALLGLGGDKGKGEAPKGEPAPSKPNETPASPKGSDDDFRVKIDVNELGRSEKPEKWDIDVWSECCDCVREKRSSESSWDEKFKKATDVLQNRFDLLDTAAGIGGKDGLIGRNDLQAALKNPDLPQDVRDAAKFLLDNPAAFNMMDVAAGIGWCDGLIGKKDVAAQKARNGASAHENGDAPTVHHQHHHHHHVGVSVRGDGREERGEGVSVNVRGGNGSNVSVGVDNDGDGKDEVKVDVKGSGSTKSSGGPASVSDMMKSGMSLEEIVQAILSRCLDGLDDEIAKTTESLDAAQKKTTGGEKGKDVDQKAKGEADKLQQRLQTLVEKRKQMFDLMSTMSSKFNESAKTAIGNLGKA